MEMFSRMMTIIMDRGLLFGFSVGLRNNEELLVSHVLFANNTLTICDANSKQLRHLRCLFLCCEFVSGLKINLAKSEIVLVGKVGDVEGLACILGFRVSIVFADEVLEFAFGCVLQGYIYLEWHNEKIERRLVGWKRLISLKEVD